VAAARKVFAEWPSRIVAVGHEVGAAVPYPGASIESDFAWAPAHPVAEAYKANGTMPYDASSQAVAAAVYATAPTDDLFKLSEAGRIEVRDDGSTRFIPWPLGKHRYIVPGSDAAWKERVVKTYTTMASAKIAAPAGRGGRAQQQNQAQQQQQPVRAPAGIAADQP
jgi:hypothetical protein